jgi:hypothetical protein
MQIERKLAGVLSRRVLLFVVYYIVIVDFVGLVRNGVGHNILEMTPLARPQ